MNDASANTELESLIAYIKRVRGFDFTGYKRSSLTRRIRKRMQEIGLDAFSDYLDYLEVHPREFVELFNTILINVTGFFRDPDTWDYVERTIAPLLIERKDSGEPIRIWSAGCASGQEAYTLAIVFAEVLGIEAFKERVKIYATDLDDEALNQARQAVYIERDLSEVPAERLDRYFDRVNDTYTFRKDLRRSVIFGRHNLIQDAPISRVDLLVCRNTLMYFNAETQSKIIERFHFALNDNGFLFLGKAEMLLSHSEAFPPVDLKKRIFSRPPRLNGRNRNAIAGGRESDERADYINLHVRLRDAAFNANPVAQVVIDRGGSLILANDRARDLFGLNALDIDRPLRDLEFSYRPVELRSCLDQLYNEQRALFLRDVEWPRNTGEILFFEVAISPLLDLAGTIIGASIVFLDVTRSKRLQQELEQANQEIEMAYEELQSTNEELETTNEELQSTNEELETTNEELQSTNEELETMNEELQSSNEELQTLNDELHVSGEELNSVNTFLSSILASLRSAVVVVDRDLQILVWNDRAEDLWGLRFEEVQGQYLLNLDCGLPAEQLLQPLRTRLAATVFEPIEIVLPAVNRRGRSIVCQITCTPLIDNLRGVQGVILLMEERES
jgi:two-component system CheB/CheR fusion protein